MWRQKHTKADTAASIRNRHSTPSTRGRNRGMHTISGRTEPASEKRRESSLGSTCLEICEDDLQLPQNLDIVVAVLGIRSPGLQQRSMHIVGVGGLMRIG